MYPRVLFPALIVANLAGSAVSEQHTAPVIRQHRAAVVIHSFLFLNVNNFSFSSAVGQTTLAHEPAIVRVRGLRLIRTVVLIGLRGVCRTGAFI